MMMNVHAKDLSERQAMMLRRSSSLHWADPSRESCISSKQTVASISNGQVFNKGEIALDDSYMRVLHSLSTHLHTPKFNGSPL